MNQEASYSETTHGVKVTVLPFYLEERSFPEEDQYLWGYRVRIENLTLDPLQLLSRHWIITDVQGYRQEIKGSGVVGETPTLDPGGVFEYTSGTPLNTPSGMMMGFYEMERGSGDRFWVTIPPFSLDSPHQKVILN